MNSVATDQDKPSADVVLELECEIEEDVEAELEDFVRLNHTGQFRDAHELYDECLSSHVGWYPVAAEYADCLLREGDFEQLVAFSKKAAANFQDPSERALLNLMYVIGGLLPKDVMWQRLQSLWQVLSLKPPFTSLRDTDIHLLEIVLQIIVHTRRRPEDLDKSNLTSAGSWSVFKDWFHYLLHHDYFWEAQRILHSLLHVLPRLECWDLVQDHIKRAVSTNIGQESVQIAVSSIVQRFVYVVESGHLNPLAVARWNDNIHWALFGVTLAKAGEESTSPFCRICLRRLFEEDLDIDIHLPLDGSNGNDEMSNWLFQAVMDGDVEAKKQALLAGPIRYTWDELSKGTLLIAARYSKNLLPFLNPRTMDARDVYQRTPLHWASLNGQVKAVELLLSEGMADAGLLDWFGCTTLHYAVRRCVLELETEHVRVVKALLMSDSVRVNKKDPAGLTPLRMAIVKRSYNVAEILLQHKAIVETNDYENLPLDIKPRTRWEQLLSKYDHSQPYLRSSAYASGAASITANLSSPSKFHEERWGLTAPNAGLICEGFEANEGYVMDNHNSTSLVESSTSPSNNNGAMTVIKRPPRRRPKKSSQVTMKATNLIARHTSDQAPHLPFELSYAAFQTPICVTFLIRNFLEQLDTGRKSLLPTWNVDNVSGTARDSINALALAFFGKSHHQQNIVNQGAQYYSKALRKLAHDLNDEKVMWSSSVLLSSILLARYDLIALEGSAGWIQHAGGVERLFKLRGPRRHQTLEERHILEAARPIIVIKAITDCKRTFLDRQDWLTIPWAQDPGQKSSMNLLIDIFCMIPSLLEDSKRLHTGTSFLWHFTALTSPSTDISPARQGLVALRHRTQECYAKLQRWKEAWDETYPFAVHPVKISYFPPSDLKFPEDIFSYAFTFPSFLRASEYQLYNSVVFFLSSLMLSIPPTSQGDFDSSPHVSDLLTQRWDAAYNICRTVPYDLFEKHGGGGAYLLLFPLLINLRFFGEASYEGKWIKHVLGSIAQKWGLKMTLEG